MIAELYTSNKVDVIFKLRRLFFQFLYTIENINMIMGYISSKLDVFSINFDQSNMSINIRIKKSCAKKIQNFTHSPAFYYTYLTDVFSVFFVYNLDLIKSKYIEYYGSFDNGFNYIDGYCMENWYHLVNILTIGDNAIVIKL